MAASPPAPAAVDRLLRSLPEWFGIESAIVEYVDAAGRLETILAWPVGEDKQEPVGVLLIDRHFESSAEVHLVAVDRSWHRSGVGRALVDHAVDVLRRDGVRLLSVKTLGPSHPSPEYVQTRRFYYALGFLPVEELHGLWPGNPCLIMAKFLHSTPIKGTAHTEGPSIQ